MVIEWQGFAAERGRPQPSRQTLSRHNQATETGWPCSTGFTNSFRRLGGSLAHVLELVAGEAWRRWPHGFFSNIRMTSSGISRGGAVVRSHSACVIVGGMGERTGAGSVVPSTHALFQSSKVEVGVAAEHDRGKA